MKHVQKQRLMISKSENWKRKKMFISRWMRDLKNRGEMILFQVWAGKLFLEFSDIINDNTLSERNKMSKKLGVLRLEWKPFFFTYKYH